MIVQLIEHFESNKKCNKTVYTMDLVIYFLRHESCSGEKKTNKILTAIAESAVSAEGFYFPLLFLHQVLHITLEQIASNLFWP